MLAYACVNALSYNNQESEVFPGVLLLNMDFTLFVSVKMWGKDIFAEVKEHNWEI